VTPEEVDELNAYAREAAKRIAPATVSAVTVAPTDDGFVLDISKAHLSDRTFYTFTTTAHARRLIDSRLGEMNKA
jgi:hypothetical protein